MLEPLFLAILTLNTLFYSNVGTGLYLICVGILTFHSLSTEIPKIRFKNILCKAIIIIAFANLITKCVFLRQIYQEDVSKMSATKIAFYQSMGLYIKSEDTSIQSLNTFMTIFSDIVEALISIFLIILYSYIFKDRQLQKEKHNYEGSLLH